MNSLFSLFVYIIYKERVTPIRREQTEQTANSVQWGHIYRARDGAIQVYTIVVTEGKGRNPLLNSGEAASLFVFYSVSTYLYAIKHSNSE